MNINMIVLDLDGTLFDSQKHVSPANRAALHEAMERGAHVVIASGRPASALTPDILSIDGIQYAITSNGSSIFRLSDGCRIYKNDMSAAAVTELLPIIKGADFPYECAIAGSCYTMQEYFNDPAAFGLPGHMREYVQETRTPVQDMYSFIRSHVSEIEGIFFLIPDQDEKKRIREQVSKIPDIYMTSSTSYYLEMASGTVSKASALDTLARKLGITRSEILAFGDSANDIELIRYAGTGVAMENASDDLKAAADAVTLSNDDDGVARYINDILCNKKM